MKIKNIITMLLFITVILGGCNVCFADMKSNIMDNVAVKAPETANNLAGTVLQIAQIVCFTAAIVLIMWMGIKWLTSAPEGKAEMKKQSLNHPF